MNREVPLPTFSHPNPRPMSLVTQCDPVASGADDSTSGFVPMTVNTQYDTLQWIMVKNPALLCFAALSLAGVTHKAGLENWRQWHCVGC